MSEKVQALIIWAVALAGSAPLALAAISQWRRGRRDIGLTLGLLFPAFLYVLLLGFNLVI